MDKRKRSPKRDLREIVRDLKENVDSIAKLKVKLKTLWKTVGI